jgi:hypothetical protein
MNTRVLLILSICLNVALGGLVVYKRAGKSEPAKPETAAKPADPAASAKTAKGDAKTVTVTVPTASALDWRIVESEDYKKYIANLRAIGCPEETIRDIITADVNKLFEARKKEMTGSTNKFQYWKVGTFFTDMFNEEKLQKNRQLAKEKQALLKELLGVDIAEKPDIMGGMNPYETLLDFLPAERQSALMNLEQDFAAKTMKRIKDAQNNPKVLRELQAEKDAELAKILSPQEKEEYDLRLSQTSMMMRMQLTDFQPTEQEFRDIFKLRKKFDDEFTVMGAPAANTADERARRDAAQKELDNNMKGALGDRYTEYKYDSDWARSSLRDVAKEYNVPKEQALKVFDLKTVAQEQAATVRKDQSLTPEQREAALQAIQQETRNAVNAVMGPNAGEAYFNKGSWLKNLAKAGQNSGQNNGQ